MQRRFDIVPTYDKMVYYHKEQNNMTAIISKISNVNNKLISITVGMNKLTPISITNTISPIVAIIATTNSNMSNILMFLLIVIFI